QFPSGEQDSPSVIINAGFSFSNSSHVCSSTSKNVSGDCAPDTAYLLLSTKNGTPLMPIDCACISSCFTSLAKASELKISFTLLSSNPMDTPVLTSVSSSSIFFPSIKYALNNASSTSLPNPFVLAN